MDYGDSDPMASNNIYQPKEYNETASKRYTSTKQTANMVIQEEDEQDTDRVAATESRRDVKRGSKLSMPGKDINVDAVSDMASSKSSVRHRRGGGSIKTGPLGGEDSSSNVDRRTMQPRSEGIDSTTL